MTSEDSDDCKHTTYFICLPDIWLPFDKWLCSHPTYRAVFYQTIEQLFYGSGPMAICERHYIALMAASRHRCQFLINLHMQEFKRTGGKHEWLKGLSYASEKIQNLDILNAVLAHEPWSANVDHLITLTKCCSPTNWCLSELVQASVILAHTHVLCSFVLGNGIAHLNGYTGSYKMMDDKKSDSSSEIELLLEGMDQLKKAKLNIGLEQPGEREMQKYFLEAQNVCENVTSTISERKETSLSTDKLPNNCVEKESMKNCDDISSIYTFNSRLDYVDFAKRAHAGFARTHKIHEFSWEDQGYSCVDELYNEMADILDKKIALVQNLSYSTMGNYSDVDTSKYRNAIWMYIQSLYGIRHDDYNYAEVNIMLNRKMKTFIKIACCHPHQMTDSLRQSIMIDFKSSEKIHVLMIVTEARLQAELIYFFRALVKLNNSPTIV
ncbi:Sestrin-3 [Dirofilaria immitis]